MKLSKLSVILGLGVAAITGCQSSKDAKPNAEQAKNNNNSEETTTGQDTVRTPDGVVLHTIYFDFDKFDIRNDQHDRAMEMARSLKTKSNNVNLQIQGHCDDRGSVEYNIALGHKRAQSLKRFFVTAGIDANNVSTVSFGKERPIAVGQTEEAWSKNRRDEVIVK